MKKIIVISLIILLALSSCDLELIKNCEDWYDYDTKKVPEWAMEDIDSMTYFVYSNKYVKWSSDKVLYGKNEYKATPDQTLKRMRGDCDDRASLFLAMLWKKYNKKGQIVEVKMSDGRYHALVKFKGKYYNFGVEISYTLRIIEFDFVDEWIYEYHY